MDIQKEREAFERLPLAELAIKSEFVFYNEETNSYWPNEGFCPSDAPETMSFAWKAWQAAKAQVVPDTYTPIVLALEDVQSKIAKTSFLTMDEENENEVMAVNANELAAYIDELIEAQEPTND